ncbi:hypothetical protein G6F43_011894 [Rhizopus delemar]|nr:hypothetical protein G6F43_011894 [Rhizopus delemar]
MATAMGISRIIVTPVRNFKNAIFVRIISQAGMDEIAQRFENPLYGRSLVSEIIYYGVKDCPVDHFKAFYRFAQTFITLNLLAYIRFPLCRSRSPFFASINSKILCQKILDLTWINGIDKIVLWRGVVNLNNPHFRDQDRNLRFLKTIQTGGVSVILLKKRFGTQGRYSSRCTAQHESTRYLESLPSAN